MIRATLSIAEGDLRAPLPPGDEGDEIGRMAAALHVFRDTAIEIEDKNLRAVARAQQRLLEAIESISEGFALFDETGALVLSNTRFSRIMTGREGHVLSPGASCDQILAEAGAAGRIAPGQVGRARWTEMLREDAEDDGMSDYLEPLDRIKGADKHLLGLINEILDLSKIEAGKLELAVETVDLEPLLRDVAMAGQTLATANANRL